MPTQTPPDAAAIDAIRQHGHELADRLCTLANAVTQAVADGDDGQTEALSLFSWYRGDLLPQFRATEATVYARGREREATALLVQALTSDHVQMKELFEELDSVDDSGRAAALAGAAKAVYAAHLAKESDLLLPALAKAGVAMAELVSDRPELAGGARKQAPPKPQTVTAPDGSAPTIAAISGTEELDVRALSHQARHGVILGKMKALTETGSLVLINDHDPLPLKYQAEAMWPDQFAWTYLDEGPVEWRVSIARV
ncbi:MAG: DUF2249 domain-containing protein [Nakamurella sp.]